MSDNVFSTAQGFTVSSQVFVNCKIFEEERPRRKGGRKKNICIIRERGE